VRTKFSEEAKFSDTALWHFVPNEGQKPKVDECLAEAYWPED